MTDYCFECNALLLEGKKFCADCGAPVAEPTIRVDEHAPLMSSQICSACGELLIEGKKFCADWGHL